MIIDFQLIIKSLPKLLQGALVTLEIAAFGCCIGLSLGIIVALIQTGNILFPFALPVLRSLGEGGSLSKGYTNVIQKLLRLIVNLYVVLFRGTPMLIQILCAYFVLPQFGIRLSALSTAIITIGLNSGAYISQIIRSGIASIGIGQIEAAQVLGLSKIDTIRFIVLPQALRVVLPALGNEFITLVKDSTLASLIGVMELTKQATAIMNQTYDYITMYAALAAIYLLITSLISCLIVYIEKRMAIDTQS